MEAAQTQMNVRIDAERKTSGDAVLAQFDLTPTYAVRALWNHLSTHKTLPDFMAPNCNAGESTNPTFLALAEEGAGLATRLARRAGVACDALQDLSYDELIESVHEDRFDEWNSRDV